MLTGGDIFSFRFAEKKDLSKTGKKCETQKTNC